MTETLAIALMPTPATESEGSEMQTMDLQTFRSLFKGLSETRLNLLDCSSGDSLPDPEKLFEECASHFQGVIKQIELEESNVASLKPQDLDAYMEQLKNEISSTVEENLKISNEIDDLTRTLAVESNILDGNIESLAFSLSLVDSQGAIVRSCSEDAHEGPMDVCEENKFEILKLQQHIEKCKNGISTLQDLDFVVKRMEAIGQIEDKLSAVKVLEFEGNCIRLSMKTHIPSSDGFLLRHKSDCLVDSSIVEHELLIEVAYKNLEPQKVEIFPNDVPLNDIIYALNSSSHLLIGGSSLEYLVRQVQSRILLCTLSRLLVRDAKKSRHSFQYSDMDKSITAHLVGGIEAFITIPESWPISNSGLKLVSIKNSDIHSKSISLSFLCKIKEVANSLNIQIRSHIVRFLDAIEEILVQETQSELHSHGIST